jgi:nicotinamide-nucleotide amidase
MLNSTEKNRLLSQQLGELLLKKHWMLCTVESCTGGALASAITSIPGASQWFGYGFVTYANNAKQKLLQVSEKTLAELGAVSELAAKEMVSGAKELSAADVAIAVTGVAGPSGGSPEKPVGGVWFAFAMEGQIFTKHHVFQGDRLEIQSQAVGAALETLLALLEANQKNTV